MDALVNFHTTVPVSGMPVNFIKRAARLDAIYSVLMQKRYITFVSVPGTLGFGTSSSLGINMGHSESILLRDKMST